MVMDPEDYFRVDKEKEYIEKLWGLKEISSIGAGISLSLALLMFFAAHIPGLGVACLMGSAFFVGVRVGLANGLKP